MQIIYDAYQCQNEVNPTTALHITFQFLIRRRSSATNSAMIASKRGFAELSLFISVLVAQAYCHMETVYEWKYHTFNLPSDYPINEDTYNPKNIVPYGIEKGWDKVFVTIPNVKRGNPSTLNYIPWGSNYTEKSPTLQAYPSWEYQHFPGGKVNCSKLISVYRARADQWDRLWVLDSGVLDEFTDLKVVCPPKLVVFDMNTDKLIKQFIFPSDVLRENTVLKNLVIDFADCGSPEDIFVYIADSVAFGLIVLDVCNNKIWRLEDYATMGTNKEFNTATVAGDKLTLSEGICGLALSLTYISGERFLFYQPFTSFYVYAIPTSVLKAAGPTRKLKALIAGRKPSQGLGLAVNLFDGTLYTGPLQQTAILSWLLDNNKVRVKAYDPERLQVANDLNFAIRDYGKLWVLSTRGQKFITDSVNFEEINYRILRICAIAPGH